MDNPLNFLKQKEGLLKDKEGLMKDADRMWKMLDDMSQNDPEEYKKFIDKNLKEGKESMDQPKFWFSVHAKDKDTAEPLYINMCSMQRVPKPKSDNDGINLYSGKEFKDSSGEMVKKIEYLATNPHIYEEIGEDKEMRNMLVKQAVNYFNMQKGYNLSYNCGVSKKIVGIEQNMMVSFLPNFKPSEPAPEPKLDPSDIKLPFQVSETPDINLETPFSSSEDTKPNKNLISEISSETNDSHKINFNVELSSNASGHGILIVKVLLSNVDNISDVDLEILDSQLVLTIDDEASYCDLPTKVDEEGISARFSKDRLLTVTLPCV